MNQMELHDQVAVNHFGIMLDVACLPGNSLTVIQPSTTPIPPGALILAQLLIDDVVRHQSSDAVVSAFEVRCRFEGPIQAGRYGLRYIAREADGVWRLVDWKAATCWPDDRVIDYGSEVTP